MITLDRNWTDDWRLLALVLIAAVGYSDLEYFFVVSERLITPERSGFEMVHLAVERLRHFELPGEALQSRMLAVWLYAGIWWLTSGLLGSGVHAMQLTQLAVQSLAVLLYAGAAYFLCRATMSNRIASIVFTALAVQALLSTQFSYPFGGAFREGFFFLGVAMALASPQASDANEISGRSTLLWGLFYVFAAAARYDIAMLVALIAMLIAVSRRQWRWAGMHIVGAALVTVVYQLIRLQVGATDTVFQNFYEVDAAGSRLRVLLALENLSFPLSLVLLFNVGLFAVFLLKRACDWPLRITFAVTLVYSIFLVFVGSHVEPRLWLPMAAVLMLIVFRWLAGQGYARADEGAV